MIGNIRNSESISNNNETNTNDIIDDSNKSKSKNKKNKLTKTNIFLDLYSPKDQSLSKSWISNGKSSVIFDSRLKSYVLMLDSTISKFSYTQKLSLNHQFIVFQIYIYSLHSFNIELQFNLLSNLNKRLRFSFYHPTKKEKNDHITNTTYINSINDTSINNNYEDRIVNNKYVNTHYDLSDSSVILNKHDYLHTNNINSKILLKNLVVGSWVNLSIDVFSFLNKCFPNDLFTSLNKIEISGNIKIRRVFGTKNYVSLSSLPKNLAFPNDIKAYNNFFNAFNYQREHDLYDNINKSSLVGNSNTVGEANQTDNNKSNLNLNSCNISINDGNENHDSGIAISTIERDNKDQASHIINSNSIFKNYDNDCNRNSNDSKNKKLFITNKSIDEISVKNDVFILNTNHINKENKINKTNNLVENNNKSKNTSSNSNKDILNSNISHNYNNNLIYNKYSNLDFSYKSKFDKSNKIIKTLNSSSKYREKEVNNLINILGNYLVYRSLDNTTKSKKSYNSNSSDKAYNIINDRNSILISKDIRNNADYNDYRDYQIKVSNSIPKNQYQKELIYNDYLYIKNRQYNENKYNNRSNSVNNSTNNSNMLSLSRSKNNYRLYKDLFFDHESPEELEKNIKNEMSRIKSSYNNTKNSKDRLDKSNNNSSYISNGIKGDGSDDIKRDKNPLVLDINQIDNSDDVLRIIKEKVNYSPPYKAQQEIDYDCDN